MPWADKHIENLLNGETVSFRPKGNSMIPLIKSGKLYTLEPAITLYLSVDDIVLCKVKGSQYIHLIKAIDNEPYQIGNNCGRINGWVSKKSIFGKLIKVEA